MTTQPPAGSLANDQLRRLARTLGADVEHCERRILQEIVTAATSAYWHRRAKEFAAVGNTRCDEVAVACANAALFTRWARDPDAVNLGPPPRGVDQIRMQGAS